MLILSGDSQILYFDFFCNSNFEKMSSVSMTEVKYNVGAGGSGFRKNGHWVLVSYFAMEQVPLKGTISQSRKAIEP